MPARLAPVDCPNAGPHDRTDTKRAAVSFIAHASRDKNSRRPRRYGASMDPVHAESWQSHRVSVAFSWMAVKLRLGDLTFDSSARQLLRGTAEIHLSPKAFELLKTLIDQRPRALSKNELHEHLWPTTFVSEANLASLIAEIREALGDTARQPRFIRTPHRFGYAFSGQPWEDPVVHAGSDSRAESMTPLANELDEFCWLVQDGKRMPLADG